MTSSGLTPWQNSAVGNASRRDCCIRGIRVEPPTKITWNRCQRKHRTLTLSLPRQWAQGGGGGVFGSVKCTVFTSGGSELSVALAERKYVVHAVSVGYKSNHRPKQPGINAKENIGLKPFHSQDSGHKRSVYSLKCTIFTSSGRELRAAMTERT